MHFFTQKFLKYYLFFIFITSIYFLYNKFLYPTDWTTSEWLINYQGGFVRRGLSGEFLFQLNRYLNFDLRYLVFYLNIFILIIFYLIFYDFIKNVKLNELLTILLYSPFFLLYPAAEPEVIARKEFLLFSLYILYINLLIKNDRKVYLFLVLTLPIMNLIWDGMLFYIFFFFIAFFFKKKFTKKDLIYFLICLIPYFVSIIFVVLGSTNPDGYKLICNSIGENCWGALMVLSMDLPLSYVISYVYENLKIDYLVRYIFLFSLAFLPFLLIFYYEKNKFSLFNSSKAIFVLYLCSLFPIIVFHVIANDWGRWINIGYFFSFITLIYFIKIKLVNFDNNNISLKFKFFLLKYPKTFYTIFYVYILSWNMKATMTDDIGSLPYYRIIMKFLKYLTSQV